MLKNDDSLKDLKELTQLINSDKASNRHRPSGNPLTAACGEEITDNGDGPESTLSVTKNASMWSTNGTNYFATERAEKQLEAGQYVVNSAPSVGHYFTKKEINLDDLLVLPDSNSEEVIDTIEYFWDNEEKFRGHGFLWKRGILLWGPPGSGKTSTVQQLSKQIVDIGGITIYCDHPNTCAEGLTLLRQIEPNRPIVVILEDIDAIIENYGEIGLLSMLDGEHQTDNVVYLATTNYPDRLDQRFINRPSRFDEIIKIGMPKPAARQYYLAATNPRLLKNEYELNKWVNETEGFSIAHLKELIISVECFGKSFTEAHSRLKLMIDATAAQYNSIESKQFGFIGNNAN